MKYWLFKTEPDEFSIYDLAKLGENSEPWGGVRNYQARNFLRDEIKQGDLVFIYHSSCKEVGIAGVAEVSREGYPDPLQFDRESDYYDPKSAPSSPRWFQVDVRHKETFPNVLKLSDIKTMDGISDIPLVKKGGRLSIMPVNAQEWSLLYDKASRR